MKIFENKSLLKKIAIILIIVTIFSFCFPETVSASDDGVGGKLLSPIVDLFVFLGDGVMNIIHGAIFSNFNSTIHIDMTAAWWEIASTILVGVVVAVVVAVVVIATGGLAAAGATAIMGAIGVTGVTISSIGVGTVLLISLGSGVAAAAIYNSNILPDNIYLPVYQISPDKIFSNEVLLFDVDFFNPTPNQTLKDVNGNVLYGEDGNPIELESTASQLRNIISNWYRTLRDIAIVALLSILVYIGIRIIISSTSNDKSKYKQMLIDWVVAICLLFVMQYIMSFSNLIIKKVTEVVKDVSYDMGHFPVIEDEDGKIEDALEEMGFDIDALKDGDYIVWHTDLVGLSRLNAQMAKKENTSYAGYALIFIVLVLFTCYFIFTYLKRVLYMAFLTLIAPLVAMTYPIDKINDGKAQAFNMWFKEYIFNLLIQPMHLLLYTILVTSAFELASTNIIYSLVALGFMMPAEKLLRRFFGFEKAHTPGLLAGPAGAALMMSGMSKLLGRGSKGGKDSSKNNKVNNSDDEKAPRINDNFDKDGALFDGDEESDENIRQEDLPDSQEGTQNPQGPAELPESPVITQPRNVSNPMDNTENQTTEQDDRANNFEDMFDDDSVSYRRRTLSNNRTSNNGRETNRRKINKRSVLASAGAVSRYYARGMANNMKKGLKNKISNAHPIQSAARFTAKAAGAAALGGIGMAIGITSGDLSKTAQYTTAGAVGGYRMAGGAINKFDSLTPEGVSEVAERARYDTEDDYKKAKQEQYKKNYQKNEKNMFELEQRFGRKDAKRIMDEDIPQLLDNGVTKMEDIATIEAMLKDNKIKDIKEGIAIKKYASRINEDSTKMTEKKRDEWRKTFATEFGKKEKYRNQNHDNMANSVLDKVDAYNKIKFK